MDTVQESIIDPTRPNAGRIYDYLLGGRHNLSIDRDAAEQVKKLVPFLPKMVRMQRWCLQDLAIELTQQRKYDVIIDFASGLPTEDHIHCQVPQGTVVIYSDYDPVVVEYAHEILGDTPNVYYFLADARRPEELLTRPAVQTILQGRRDVALVYWGVAAFLPDDDIAYAAQELYRWAGSKSCWAFNAQGANVNADELPSRQVCEIYERMGTPGYLRSLEQYKQLLQPWRFNDQGFVSLLDWHNMDRSEMSPEDRQVWSESGGGYGAYLSK